MAGRNKYSTLACILLSLWLTTVEASPHFSVKPPRRTYPKFELDVPQNVLMSGKADLPRNTVPEHYTLRIRPILNDAPEGEQFTAPGYVSIVVNCLANTNEITLHKEPALQINTSSILLFALGEDGSHGNEVEVTGTVYDEPNVFYTFQLGTELEAGQRYELSLSFISEINDQQSGLYRAQYLTPSGETRYMATTQFESYGARRAFPCFDEPGLKATFDISIARQTERNSLCNTLPKSVGVVDPSLPEGWVWDVYNQTVPMSSYLVAIIVSDFVCEEADPTIFEGRPVRMCGPPYQIEDYKAGVMGADAAARVMRLFEENFKYPYEMFKLDNAAIPRNYFGPGAMENWGLVTYRDNYVLHYDTQTTESERQLMWSIIAHELGHQWFGNILTCATWGHLWLNEGFASYVSFMFDRIVPEFDGERDILWDTVQNALGYDVGRDEPIYNEDRRSGSTIIYDKGASVLRMVESLFGKQLLYDAFAEYLNRHAYQPVMQDQLFAVLTEFAHANNVIPADMDMKQIMDTWTVQPGYPVLRVSKVDAGSVQITQELYLSKVPDQQTGKTNEPKVGTWEIPVAIASASNPDFSNHTPALWLRSDVVGRRFEHDTSSWLVLNPDAMSYYRVNYANEFLALIHGQLEQDLNSLSGLSRSQLLDDYFSFGNLGHEPIDKALELTKYMENEDDSVVWFTFLDNIDFYRKMFEKSSVFDDYLLPKLDAVLNRLLENWTVPLNAVGSGTRVIYIAELLSYACFYDSVKCNELALDLFTQWMAEPERLTELMPPDFEYTMLCSGVAQAGQDGFDFLLDQYNNADPFGLHKDRFEDALACSDLSILQRFLIDNLLSLGSGCKGKNCVRNGNPSSILLKAAAHPISRKMVVTFLKEFGSLIQHRFGERVVADIIKTLSETYNTDSELYWLTRLVAELGQFLPNQLPILEESIQTVKNNIQWMVEHGEAANKWFNSKH